MARGRTPDTIPMLVTLDPHGGPRHQQLYSALRDAILSGTLRRGDRLPSTRILARDLGVSRTTVLGAFSRLLAEGYVTGNAGAGTRVAQRPIEARRSTRPSPIATQPFPDEPDAPLSESAKALFAEGRWRKIPLEAIPFAPGIPALDLFPLTTWTRLAAKRWRLSGRDLLLPGEAQGYRLLREAVARYAVTARGVRCTPEQVLIVNGASHAIDLIARLLVGPGDKVWMEAPCYLPARGALAAAGATIVDVPVDTDGLDVAKGRALAPEAKLAFLTPSFHSPLGYTMSISRRKAMLEWAREANAWIVEDDYNGEYRYDTAQIPALQGLDRHGRVLYVGTFSKSLSPAIRLGYLILPESLVVAFSRARLILDRHSPIADQAVLADFIESGHFARHIRRTRTLYKQRQRSFIALAKRELAGLVTIEAQPAGMWLVGWLPLGMDDNEVVDEARKRGVYLVAMSGWLGSTPGGPGILFGYVAYTPAQMRVAMRELAVVIRSLLDRKI